MTARPRFLASLAAEALACKTRLPWERGLRRQAMIARRKAAADRPAAAPLRRAAS